MSGRTVPVSTYRIQLRDGLTLDAVIDDGWLDHARRLGVSHLYLSPVLTATEGSRHGYDVADPTRVDPAIGGDDAFRRLAAEARRRDMGLVVDIVPNHMALDPSRNRWWWDVLRRGPDSPFAPVFDVDWAHPERRIRGSVLLPILGDHYGRVLEAGELALDRVGPELVLRYFERELPIDPVSAAPIVARAAAQRRDDVLGLIARSLERTAAMSGPERRTEVNALDELLAERVAADPAVGDALDRQIVEVNADVEALDSLLAHQHYRLAHWRAAAQDLGYRRFFDVNGLIGVRVEDSGVFELTHSAVARWIEDDLVDGLRIDHPDGLAVPAAYFERLADLSGSAWTVAEKILEGTESLPDWAVDGTTGYDVGELIGRLHLDGDGLKRLTQLRDDLVGPSPDIDELVRTAKLDILRDVLAADLNRVTDLFLQLCETQRRHRDVTRHELHEVVRETAAAMPVYRTYGGPGPSTSRELEIIGRAIADCRERRPDLDPEIFGLLGAVLAGELDSTGALAGRLAVSFEQLSGPTMAKGKEDTAWYRDVRLIGRNEVGADPAAEPLHPDAFHDRMTMLSHAWPATMTSLSTHDSKRSEDVRARSAAITGRAEWWSDVLRRWFRRHDHLVGPHGPGPVTRSWTYQTLVGAHPLGPDRLADHMQKAIREAKQETSWIRPDEEFEAAVGDYCRAILADVGFVEDLQRVVATLQGDAERISLSQKVIQLLVPGVPDLYWGSEAELLRLVDPDNRTPPDLRALSALLDGPALSDPASTRKVHVVRAALQLRRRRAAALARPDSYEVLTPTGNDADRLVGFCRPDAAVVIATIGAPPPVTVDASVELPPGGWRAVVGAAATNSWKGRVAVGNLLGDWPVAVLEPDDRTPSTPNALCRTRGPGTP